MVIFHSYVSLPEGNPQSEYTIQGSHLNAPFLAATAGRVKTMTPTGSNLWGSSAEDGNEPSGGGAKGPRLGRRI